MNHKCKLLLEVSISNAELCIIIYSFYQISLVWFHPTISQRLKCHSSELNTAIPLPRAIVSQSPKVHTFAPCSKRRPDLWPCYHCYSCLQEAPICVIILAVQVQGTISHRVHEQICIWCCVTLLFCDFIIRSWWIYCIHLVKFFSFSSIITRRYTIAIVPIK